VLLAGALAAGCGGSQRLPVLELDAAPVGLQREAGLAVMRFVQAARAGDVRGMQALMTAETRAGFGRLAEAEIARQLENFRDARIALGTRVGEDWAVGAVTGYDDDGDPAAWAAALRREDGRWRIELGGIAFARVRPAPLAEADVRAELRVEAQAGGEIEQLRLWVDRRPLRAFPVRRHPFARQVWGRLRDPLPPGLHTAVAFATSAETAGALAWIFEVEG